MRNPTPPPPTFVVLVTCEQDPQYQSVLVVQGAAGKRKSFARSYAEVFAKVKGRFPQDWNLSDVFKALRRAGWRFRSVSPVEVNY